MDPISTRPKRRTSQGVRLTSAALVALIPGCACVDGIELGQIDVQTKKESCWESESGLVRAASTRDHRQLTEIVGAGTDPDTADPDGRTALACAAMVGDRRAVEVLLYAGADPNKRGEEGGRPIIAAISGEGEFDLFNDDELNLPSERFTPLGSDDRVAIVRLLLGAGADGLGAVAPAARVGSTEIVQVFLDAKVPLTGEPGEPSPLLMAAWSGHTEVVNQLISAGADPDGGGDVDYTAALWSAYGNLPPERFGELERAGALDAVWGTADRGGRDETDWEQDSEATPLMAAVIGDHPEVVVPLLNAGADPNARSVGRLPVLWLAVAMDQQEIVSALRFAGAEPDPQPKDAADTVESPLDLATALGDEEMIALLR